MLVLLIGLLLLQSAKQSFEKPTIRTTQMLVNETENIK